ncbi:ferredoxin-1 [Parafrankia colletiae]|uniref:Ferredoxin n=1 Tax=Parafrankia colletiae TaxID=573497 RepID=A0A1S1R029_9ACTN|nr:ferredoxin [Parafrankia colletiae]MCK9903752.1 ferredoxin [Frankia sp. Cpl3]OHV40308.1 ferredoxin-1 [Parafrankia colletiae]
MARLTVDESCCVGAGRCVSVAPALFDQDEDGLVVVVHEVLPAGALPAAHEAADLCPSRAITVTD